MTTTDNPTKGDYINAALELLDTVINGMRAAASDQMFCEIRRAQIIDELLCAAMNAEDDFIPAKPAGT